MVVDDSPEEIHILIEELKNDYRVTAATSAELALERLKDELPDIMLLDVNMPGMNGHELCERINSNDDWKSIDVIFLSSNESTEEIMKGFDLGANDYIVKPYDPAVLKTKLQRDLERKHKNSNYIEQARNATDLVHTVMSESGKMANIINFLRESFSVSSFDHLMEITLSAFREFNLNTVIYVSSNAYKDSFSTHSLPTMLELELMSRMINIDKAFIENNSRTFVIHKNIVVLIRNMPEDQNARSSLKDNLRILLEGVDAKIRILDELSQSSTERISNTQNAILSAKQTLDEIHVLQEAHKKEGMEILDNMVKRVEDSFFSMGLTDHQESEIMQIMNEAINESLSHFESGLEFDERIKMVITQLSRAATASAIQSK